MVKIKMKLSLVFSTCFLAVMVFGDLDSSTNPNPSSSSSPSPAENSKTLEERIRELEKSHEKSQEEIKSLKEKVEKLEQEISQNDGVWLLSPPVRGPPGRKGERGFSDPKSAQSCSTIKQLLPTGFLEHEQTKETIYPHGNTTRSLEVLCDFKTDGGGWTIIQKRTSGPKYEFSRNWTEYQNGFGSVDGNFWIGLDNIHALTQNGDQELRIQLEDFEGEKRWAKYSNFSVSSASDFYRLSISGYSGDSTVEDDMNYSVSPRGVLDGQQFSTWDKENDKSSSENCAALRSSGWWFNACAAANLNGIYFDKGETVPRATGINWYSWKGHKYSLAKTEMKIRTRK